MEFEKVIKEITSLRNEDIKLKNIEKHIKRTYCPVKEKIEFLEKIKELSIVNGEFKLYLNKIYLTVGILDLYTDIEIKKIYKDIETLLSYYDCLIESHIIEKGFNKIEQDINELLLINQAVLDF